MKRKVPDHEFPNSQQGPKSAIFTADLPCQEMDKDLHPATPIAGMAFPVTVLSTLQQEHCSLVPATKHERIVHIIALERFSSFDNGQHRQKKARTASEARIQHYMHTFHPTSCACSPERTFILLNGISSNTDISTNSSQSVQSIRQILHRIIGKCAIIVPSPDGLCTNIEGFVAFFDPFAHQDLVIVHCSKTGRCVEFRVLDLLKTMRDVGAGNMVNRQSQLFQFVDQMIKAGLNKALVSKSSVANIAMGIGSGRNSFTLPAAETSTTMKLSMLQSQTPTLVPVNPKLIIKPTRKQPKGARSIIEYEPVMDDDTGKLICPEPDCLLQLGDIDLLVAHLVDKTMSRGYRKSIFQSATLESISKANEHRACVVCGCTFAESYGNKRQPVQVHMDRHFPGRHSCDGKCGITSCEYVGATAKCLIYHNLAANPPHQCASCDRKFILLSQLTKHVEDTHVRRYQVIGFAERAGYNVSSLLEPIPWMQHDASLKTGTLSDRLRLAEEATRAILATRKPDKTIVITWENVFSSTGGSQGANLATSCDACKLSTNKCEHRFDARAPALTREAVVKLTRCQKCKRIDRRCRHTHEPAPLCVSCGIDCYECKHKV